MAQLRQEYDKFRALDTAVVVVGPEKAAKFNAYFTEHDLPFIGLPDPQHRVLKLYGQQIKLFKFGRMPAQLLVDRDGVVRFVHYGHSMKDIPATDEMVALIEQLASSVSSTA